MGLGVASLLWVSHSEPPLKAAELCHALAVEIGSPNFNTDNVPLMGTVLAFCQGLVAVDKEASTVRQIHFTPFKSTSELALRFFVHLAIYATMDGHEQRYSSPQNLLLPTRRKG